MSVKCLSTLCITFAVALTTLTCKDTADPLNPVDPQFAKGGIPGAPEETAPVELLEYYVYQEDLKNYVHILARGSFPMVNLNVVQDYFFNGIRDDNYSIFYEYTTAAPLPMGKSDLFEDGLWVYDEGMEAWHIDIPWNGETWYRIYPDPDPIPIEFPDFPHVELAGSTGDPYAFDIRFQKENGDYIAGFQPQGIILGGVPHGPEETAPLGGFHSGDDDGMIYSYATWESTRGAGVPVFIEHLSLDESSITCEVKTVFVRDGKTKYKKEVTEVFGMAKVILSTGDPGDPIPDAWIDVMFAEYIGEDNPPKLADTFISTHGEEPWANGWGATARFDGARDFLQLHLAVDYVYATDLERGTVYAPALNNPFEEPGWSTINQGPITELGFFPIALTDWIRVDCGK